MNERRLLSDRPFLYIIGVIPVSPAFSGGAERDGGGTMDPFRRLIKIPALCLAVVMMLLSAAGAEEFSVSDEEEEMLHAGNEGAAMYLMRDMTTEEKICQLFFVSPEQLSGETFTLSWSDALAEGFGKYPVGGIMMFGQNIRDGESILEMNTALTYSAKRRGGIVVFLGISEEGGRAAPLTGKLGLSPIPAARQMTADDAYDWGTAAAERLKAYGFNLDLAPCADMYVEGGNTEIGDRSFSYDSSVTAACALLFMTGLQDHDVVSVYKHFPGIGTADSNTRLGWGHITQNLTEIRSRALVPFYSAVWENCGMILVTAIDLQEVDGGVPACFSPSVVTGLLRNTMGYNGVIITDSLRTGRVKENYSSGEAALAALEAGCDMILLPRDFESAFNAVREAVESGRISRNRLDESVQRILALKISFGLVSDAGR